MNEKWIAALRGGEYAQGVGALKDSEDKYCCLGVLAEVEGAETTESENGFLLAYIEIDGEETVHYGVLDDAWFTETTGLDTTDMSNLTFINDNGGSFAEIADALDSEEPFMAIDNLQRAVRNWGKIA